MTMTDEKRLLRQIEAFCAASGISETTFGRLAMNEFKFVSSLRAGRRCWPTTMARVRSFMEEDRRKQVEKEMAK